ncbi:hypothetical protein A6R68_23922, partial [Neotoma lepida]
NIVKIFVENGDDLLGLTEKAKTSLAVDRPSEAKEGILSQEIYCCLEMAVLLESHTLQAKFRHYNKEM